MAAMYILIYVSAVSSMHDIDKVALIQFTRSIVHLSAVLTRFSAQCSVFFGLTVLSVLCIYGPGKHTMYQARSFHSVRLKVRHVCMSMQYDVSPTLFQTS